MIAYAIAGSKLERPFMKQLFSSLDTHTDPGQLKLHSRLKQYLWPLILMLVASFRAYSGEFPFVVSRNEHERQWVQTNELGEVTSKFTEISAGLCYWDAATQTWRDSNPEIEIREGVDGGTADKGLHALRVASNANSPNATIHVTMPDGARILLKTVGIALTSLDNTQSEFISELQNSNGEKVDATTVIYRNAFAPVKADLRVRNSLAGVESDVILRERIDPTEWGLQADNCRIEVWTQVIQAPAAAVKTERIPGRPVGAGDEDQQIDFHTMSFTKGSAFQLTSQQGAAQAVANIRVAKAMEHFPEQNVSFLIEAIPFEEAAQALDALPVNEARVKRARPDGKMVARSETAARRLPSSFAPRKSEKDERFVALLDKRATDTSPGYVIDYNLGASLSSWTFRGDTTYYASGSFSMNGTTTFEGGTVIKLADSVTPTVTGPVKFLSSHYRPVVITAAKDHYVGDKIGTGNETQVPVNEYSAFGLFFDNSAANSVSNIVVRHAETAVGFSSTCSGSEVRHAQIVNCLTAINTASSITLRNVLIANSTTAAVAGSLSSSIVGEHVTMDISPTAARFSASGTASLTLRNSLIFGGLGANYSGSTTVDFGVNNPFQTAGAGSHYLNPTIVGARNAGTTVDIDPMLVSEFRQMTTVAPTPKTTAITSPTTWPISAQRDTDALDLGYHYDALDYYFTSLGVSSTLTLASGVCVAMYGNTGISFSGGGSFISRGAPNNQNHFVHYQMVQEQPTATGWPTLSTSSRFFFSATGMSGASAQQLTTSFCNFSPGGGASGICALFTGPFVCNQVSISHSFLRNVGFGSPYYSMASSSGTVILTNNCWERCSFSMLNQSSSPFTAHLYNNLFYKGNVSFYYGTTYTPWTIKDNLFDAESLYLSAPTAPVLGNNAYVYPLNTMGGSGNKTVMSPDYQTGTLGRFYYPITGANLAPLINAGSRQASAAGLAHFTVKTSNLKEWDDTTTPLGTVDIGFHYVATTFGVPADTDGDEWADYLEDVNGNGAYNTTPDLADWKKPDDTDLDGISDAIDPSPTVADTPPGISVCDKCPLQ